MLRNYMKKCLFCMKNMKVMCSEGVRIPNILDKDLKINTERNKNIQSQIPYNTINKFLI
jgi:hypothetical protein